MTNPKCFLVTCNETIEKRSPSDLFCTQKHAAEYGDQAAKGRRRHWCPECRTWVLGPHFFIWRHGRLGVS